MSNRDYTKYSREVKEPVTMTNLVADLAPSAEVEPEVEVTSPVVEPIQEQKPAENVENAEPTKPVKTGFVYGCSKLNVRSEPSSKASIICEIEQKTEVEIDESESTDEFYKVCLASGIEGYCVKTYIIEN